MTFYPINHELTKIESGKYHLVVHTDCENDITPGYKLDFVFSIDHDLNQKKWLASQPFGALMLSYFKDNSHNWKWLVEDLCSSVYGLINTNNPALYAEWQFRINSGGFYSVRFNRQNWQWFAHKNPAIKDGLWILKAYRQAIVLQTECDSIYNGCIDLINHMGAYIFPEKT